MGVVSLVRSLLFWASLLGYTQSALSQPYLILHDFMAGPTPTPAFIRDNEAMLDALSLDGLAVYMRDPGLITNVSGSVFAPTPMSYSMIYSVLSPMAGIPFRTLKQNFGLIFAGAGVDVFDDVKWAIRVQNMSNLGAALRAAGLTGIFFDNEGYEDDWSHYGGTGCSSAVHTLKACQDQARLRGQQIMKALTAAFPDIVILHLHGPYVSDMTFYQQPDVAAVYNEVAHANELAGPFFVGMVEAKGSRGKVVDGGELYFSRTAADFSARYQFQKNQIASDAGVPNDMVTRAAGPNGFIPPDLRRVWASQVSVAAGIYDCPMIDARNGLVDMNPSIMKNTITNALSRVNDYVWVYTERITFLLPPGSSPKAASVEWLNAVRDGKAAATPH